MGNAQKLFVGLPIYNGIDPLFFRRIIALMLSHGRDFILADNVGDSAVGRSRNLITRQFLESDATDLLWIDSDIIFYDDQVARIMSHDVDIVGGLYPKKQQGQTQWVINTLDNMAEAELRPEGLAEVKYVGTGFMRIRRRVFELMLDAFGKEIAYVSDGDGKTVEWDFWHMGVYVFPNGHRRYLSEDWWFCQKWRDLGGKVFADQHIVLQHGGYCVYPLETERQRLYEQARQHKAFESTSGSAAGDSPPAPRAEIPAAPAPVVFESNRGKVLETCPT